MERASNTQAGKAVVDKLTVILALASAFLVATGSTTNAQIRGKSLDRGVYQPPIIELDSVEVEPLDAEVPGTLRGEDGLNAAAPPQLRPAPPARVTPARVRRIGSTPSPLTDPQDPAFVDETQTAPASYQPGVGHAEPVHGETITQDVYIEAPIEGHLMGGDVSCCDDLYCDGCCDGYGCDSYCGGHGWSNASLCFAPGNWFGSLEVLLMFRSGDGLPALVTGASSATGAQSTLVGEQTLLDDVTAGGRVTLGTWLDPAQRRSLVFRGWSATEDRFSFFADQSTTPQIARPFVQTGVGPTALDIALPGTSTAGSVNVEATSNVFGGDFSIRQYWYGRYGGTVDFLYGYQYMRLDEDLRISSSRTDTAPIGIDIQDTFETVNEFHGGQLGVASRYREGYWSFDGIAKFGFGSLSRRSNLVGFERRRGGGDPVTSTDGLLVRSTNDGQREDNTFTWIPELDLTLGYRRFRNYELTFGYHLLVMPDALQPSGTLDPNLEANLSAPLTGDLRPAPAARYSTFYVQGIHFGLQYVY